MKVYVLDYELVSPLGVGREAVMAGLRSNLLCGRKLRRFAGDGLEVDIAAEVPEGIEKLYAGETERVRRLAGYDRKFELLLACYGLMQDRLRGLLDPLPVDRKGVVLGIGLDVTPFELIEEQLARYSATPDIAYIKAVQELNATPGRLNTVLNPLDLSANFIAHRLGLGAFSRSTLTACTASTQAIGQAFDSIRDGEADAVVTGGTDSILNLISYVAFAKLGVVQPTDGPPEKVCKPFDLARNSALVGEAAGLIVLANEKTVEKLGVRPRLELMGYGNSLDGFKITAPDPSGRGMKRALEKALACAGITGRAVDYVNLHGTGTQANDPVELASVMEVLKHPALLASSTKDRHGHAIGAAGVQEFGVLALSMENDFVPCTANLEKPIVSEGMRLVAGQNLNHPLKIAMSNNFAFGGVNTVLVLRKGS